MNKQEGQIMDDIVPPTPQQPTPQGQPGAYPSTNQETNPSTTPQQPSVTPPTPPVAVAPQPTAPTSIPVTSQPDSNTSPEYTPTPVPVADQAATPQQPSVTPPTPPTATQNPNQMQSPTVFDTNQYHLPIEKQKKHSAGKQMLIFGVVFATVLIVGGLLAIDAGLVDLGFDLPFDLIK